MSDSCNIKYNFYAFKEKFSRTRTAYFGHWKWCYIAHGGNRIAPINDVENQSIVWAHSALRS